ncbi:Endonuclease MutS2 [Roseimaritima multifibrata]|uniref:Endonuclease MutS2 n=1 Tax=Roseimaritima multifibrata TaxID=1930274 RepID=A0A517MAJ4_9BACT|nr:MutS family DNA mismatch repair protein [Roseimaritima multifibrata]QDS91912.1 Endonuclease MutS2 [Roseimaritima multifibrata]
MQRYEDRLQVLQESREACKQVDRRWHIARLLAFFSALGCLFFGYVSEGLAPLVWIGWGSVIAFLVIITLHQRVRDELEEIRRARSIVRRLLSRLQRRWDRLPLWEPSESWMESHGVSADVADDLDLFGRGSLFQLASVASTGPGLRTLAKWLGGPAEGDSADARADAIEVLAPLREERQTFYLLAKRAADGTAEPDRFVEWAGGETFLDSRRWMLTWARLSPLVFVGVFIVAVAMGSLPVLLIGWGAVVGINVLLTVLQLGPVQDIFSVALSGRGDVEGYSQLFATAEHLPDSPESLAAIRKTLVSDPDRSAVAGMRQLQTAASMASLRHSGILFIAYVILQAVALWDVHVLAVLEKWQAKHGPQVTDWFSALGSMEAFMSLAALRDEYPDWGRATWLDASQAGTVEAEQLGHPLLTDQARVSNDVSIGPPGTVLLVTGSNMSGKSTMLRSVGLNVMLASAGAPVCAKKFQLPSLELSTSIRVRDSVREGVSFYMAELKRLRAVVEHARRLQSMPERRVLYLLDEILQGTNNRERQIAVARVLGHLIDTGAIGAISTHDLDLADDPLLQSVAEPVHFRETIEQDAEGRDTMTFDYVMHRGVTPTTNALRLLEMVGLGEKK